MNASTRLTAILVFTLLIAAPIVMFAQGGLTLFGDVHITTDQGAAVPKDVSLILRQTTVGEIGRQTISNNGRYRFTNLKPGDYEIVVEVGGKEIGRLQQITVGGLSNSPYGYQYDLEFRWHEKASTPAGVVSAADVYDRPSSTKGLFQQAEAAVAKKKYDEAVTLLNKVVGTDKSDFQAWAAMGTVYMAQQKFDDAEAAFKHSIEVRPTFSRAYLNLGKLKFSQKKFEEAVEPLTKAVELEPESGEANLDLGECYLQLKKGSKAIPYLNDAARYGKPEAHLRLGWLYNAAGLKDRAAVEYEEFLKKKPDYADRKKLQEYIDANKKQ